MKPALLIIFILSFILSACTRADNDYVLINIVIDGDTLQYGFGERVRLIGIDTPEMYESEKLFRDAQREELDVGSIIDMGIESFGFTKNLVEGKKVRLEFDEQKRDEYDRLLAYVYLPEGTFVNAEIIKWGYAQPMSIAPNLKYADLFENLYQEAKSYKRGLWREEHLR